jgi:hypothetical protein
MNPDVQQRTEVTRATLEREKPIGRSSKRDQELANAEKLRKVADSRADRHTLLEQYAHQRISEQDITRFAEYGVSNTNPDATTGERRGDELTDYTEIVTTGKQLIKYLEKGDINEIKGGSNEGIRKGMQESVIRIAEMLPAADAVFTVEDTSTTPPTSKPMSETDRLKLISGVMNDPEFLAVVRKISADRLNPETAKQRLAEAIEKRKTYEDKRVAEQRAKKKFNDLGGDITHINDELKKYEVIKDKTGAIVSQGEEAQKIAELQTDVSKLISTGGFANEAAYIAKHQANVEGAQATFNAMQERLARLSIRATDTERKAATDELAEAGRQLAQAKEPLVSLTNLKTEIAKKEVAKKQLEDSLSEKTTQKDEAQSALDDAKRATFLAKAEYDLVDPVKDVRPDAIAAAAAQKYFSEKQENLTEAQQAMLQEKMTEDDEKLAERIGRMWYQDETRGRIGKFFKGNRGYVVNEDSVNKHFADLMRDPALGTGGPEALRNKLGIPKEQWDRVQDSVVQTLVQRKIESGGLREGEARIIFNSPWGGELITKAIETNKEFNEKVLSPLEAQGYLKDKSPEGIRKLIAEHPFLAALLLPMILGVGAAAVMPATAVAGSIIGGLGAGAGAAQKVGLF